MSGYNDPFIENLENIEIGVHEVFVCFAVPQKVYDPVHHLFLGLAPQ
jgi:hypothetical protein